VSEQDSILDPLTPRNVGSKRGKKQNGETKRPPGFKEVALGAFSRKSEKSLKPGTIEPRNITESYFIARFGTVTPIPEATNRRMQQMIDCCILYIHHNKSIKECSEITGLTSEWITNVKTSDGWDQFKQQLLQMAQPSMISLIEHFDMEKIKEERDRRMTTLADLRQAEAEILSKIAKLPVGSMAQTGAINNINAIRKMIDSMVGLDFYTAEQHAARKQVTKKTIEKLTAPANTEDKAKKAKGEIIDL